MFLIFLANVRNNFAIEFKAGLEIVLSWGSVIDITKVARFKPFCTHYILVLLRNQDLVKI